MKRKGFTLIELLAVIVILAVIALIATPIILNVIEKAKKGAAKSSALGYLNAVENQVAINAVDTNKEDIVDGDYEVSELSTKGVSVKGNGPTSGTITLTKGQVTSCSLVIDKYTVTCLGNGKVQVGEIGITTEEPNLEKTKGLLKIVYLDPTDYTKKCDVSNSVSTTGTKEGCMKWYVYKDDGTNYTMILDHNTTPLVAWNSEGSNTEMKEVKAALENDTKDWNTKSRLITADEVAEITGAKDALKWGSSKTSGTDDIETQISWFYLDGLGTTYSSEDGWQKQVATQQGSSKYAWLYDNTYECKSYGCNIEDSSNYGYWTSTLTAGTSSFAWSVRRLGSLKYDCSVDFDYFFGVRPVITIPKTIIN